MDTEGLENYRVLIVEDEVFIAEDLKRAIIKLGYDVCDVCYDSESALDSVFKHQPDMVMLDINIRGSKDGIEVAEAISKNYNIPFIFLSSLSDRTTLDRAKLTKPMGYLVKPFKDQDLLTTIEMAIYRYSSELRKKHLDKTYIDSLTTANLSTKEYEVLMDLIDGLNNTQIALKQFISINTVKTHVKRIFIKLDVHDRISVVRKVIA